MKVLEAILGYQVGGLFLINVFRNSETSNIEHKRERFEKQNG
jgi:hypothetical protein